MSGSGADPSRHHDVLALRAARYARQAATQTEATSEVVMFQRAGRRYAVPLETLREIRPLKQLTVIPGARPVVLGVFHFRGELLSVHDLAALLASGPLAREAGWALVVEHGATRIALWADEVIGVERHAVSRAGPVPVTLGEHAVCFLGVLPDGALLIHPEALFNHRSFLRAF